MPQRLAGLTRTWVVEAGAPGAGPTRGGGLLHPYSRARQQDPVDRSELEPATMK